MNMRKVLVVLALGVAIILMVAAFGRMAGN
jgi:hypothetical protein